MVPNHFYKNPSVQNEEIDQKLEFLTPLVAIAVSWQYPLGFEFIENPAFSSIKIAKNGQNPQNPQNRNFQNPLTFFLLIISEIPSMIRR